MATPTTDSDSAPPITDVSVLPYRLALRTPWISGRMRTSLREGWIIRLATADGLEGLGDCAPLPTAGTEQPSKALGRLEGAPGLLRGLTPHQGLDRLPPWPGTPAARCALETALLDLCARRAGRPLALWLNNSASPRISVNDALGHLDQVSDERVLDSLAKGFTRLKIKLAADPSSLSRIEALAGLLPPDARLRLDANRAWEHDLAERMLGGLRDLPVDSLEEPLAHPEPARLASLQARVPWALALDETLADLNRERWLLTPAVRRLVLKPSVLGGLLPSLRLARWADEAGIETVVTSTLESAVGLWAGVHLAAALARDIAHGLATGSWLREPGDAPLPESGGISLTKACGLGIQRPPSRTA
jgi:o-succinylbenzoate synthase